MANDHDAAFLPETPAEALGPTVRERITILDRTFVIGRPDAVDRLTDHPTLGTARAGWEYLPVWAHLWPVSKILAEAVLREPWPADAPRVLELGCGLGLAGLAALARNLPVIFSDYDAAALRYAAENARGNGFTDFTTLQMDWRKPAEGLQVPVILASDPIYEMDMAAPLADLIARALAPHGLCLLTDQNRLQGQVLRQELQRRGFAVTIETRRAPDAEGRQVEGILSRVTW